MTGLISLCSLKETPHLPLESKIISNEKSPLGCFPSPCSLTLLLLPGSGQGNNLCNSTTPQWCHRHMKNKPHDSVQGNAKGKPEKI